MSCPTGFSPVKGCVTTAVHTLVCTTTCEKNPPPAPTPNLTAPKEQAGGSVFDQSNQNSQRSRWDQLSPEHL